MAQHHLKAQQESELSVKDYCAEHHLVRSAFYRWRKEYGEQLSTFVPIVISESGSTDKVVQQTSLTIVFRFPNGIEATTSIAMTQFVELLYSQSLCSR